jgi:predicted extracellular nuclease
MLIDDVQSTRAAREAFRLIAGLTCLLLTGPAAAQQVNPNVGIRQVYGGGGNANAPYTNDFIELFNRSASAVSLAGWSVQYGSASGNLGSNASTVTPLPNVTLQAGQSFLVQESSGGATGAALPTADWVGTISMAATAGKLALVSSPTALNCGGTTTTCSASQLTQLIDLVGYGSANFFEGSAAAPTLANTTAALRAAQGCTDSNDNRADFVSIAPAPHNTATPIALCGSVAGSVGACGDPVTTIAAIQGTAAASPLVGSVVNIEGVVVGDFQDAPIHGFFVQTPDAKVDTDPNTSEGLFVFGGPNIAVAAGDLVRVRGQVSEFQSLTELSAVSDIVACGSAQASALALSFPVSNVADLEHYEGMLTRIDQALTVTGNFDLGRFGSLDLSVGGRLYQPTNVVAPGAGATALQSTNDRSRIILDDANDAQDPNPIPFKDANNTRRVGDSLDSLVGVLDGRFAAYRIQATAPLNWIASNPRPATPAAVGGRLRVGFANVLNFFTTLDTGSNPVCGPSGGLDCRGANTAAEFDRQRTKLLNGLRQLDYDVVGLSELENNSSASIQSLVDGLNAQTPGTYAFVNTGTIGTDAIKVGILYKPAKLSLVGTFALLTSAVNPLFIDTKNRPALAQTFGETASGERFTLIVNHLKSKGSDCLDVGDPDTGDGQGNCNQTRNKAAQALLSWIATDPTHSGDPDFMISGDLNSYAKEDPISTLKAGGCQALLETHVGPQLYSYQFDGQSGALDHVLATASLASQISGVTEWHNNADEPVVLDYNTEFKTDDPFNINDPFRASDHDPILVGLSLAPAAGLPTMHRWQCGVLGVLLLGFGALFMTSRERR